MHSSPSHFSDIDYSRIIFAKTPKKLHPYIKLGRFDRPIGIWLLLLPCLWSITLAKGNGLHLTGADIKLSLLFFAGAVFMRAAGCTINDMWDHKLDAKVERTQTRPLAAGEIRLVHAFIFLCALLGVSLAILLSLNTTTILLGFASIVPVIIYPLMKRITFVPQLFLGLTINWGALMGWTAIHDSLALPCLYLYLGGMFWTLGYDTIYAHQDKEDDALIGIKSTALLFKEHSQKAIALFYALSLLFLILAKFSAAYSIVTYITLLLPVLFAIKQMHAWKPNTPESCLFWFKANRLYGVLVLLLMLT